MINVEPTKKCVRFCVIICSYFVLFVFVSAANNEELHITNCAWERVTILKDTRYCQSKVKVLKIVLTLPGLSV